MKKDIYVLKLGSNILLKNWKIDENVIKHITKTIFNLKQQNIDTIIVSSWAVALGRNYLWIDLINWLTKIESSQVFASVWQPILMEYYKYYLAFNTLKVSQVLLTRRDFSIKENYNSIKKVLFSSLSSNIIPIINENDVITPEELDFSDNDQLAVLVSGMIGASKIIILSNVNWLYNNHPDNWWVLVKLIDKIDENIINMASDKKSTYWKWGMLSKIKTAKMAMDLWIDMYIINWKKNWLIEKLVNWENPWTLFKSEVKTKIDSIRKWLKAWAVPVWKIQVSTIIWDLLKNKKRASILAIWIEKIIYNFLEKDVVEVINEHWECLWLGIAKMNSVDIIETKNNLESKIVIHTDYFMYLSDFDKSF